MATVEIVISMAIISQGFMKTGKEKFYVSVDDI